MNIISTPFWTVIVTSFAIRTFDVTLYGLFDVVRVVSTVYHESNCDENTTWNTEMINAMGNANGIIVEQSDGT